MKFPASQKSLPLKKNLMPLFKRQQRISFSREMAGHPLFLWTRILSLVLIALSLLLIVWKIMPLRADHDVIALHYNAVFGVDLLGSWYQVFLLPLIGLGIFIANTLFARQLWEKEYLLSCLFAVTTIIAEVLLCIAVVFITLLNL